MHRKDPALSEATRAQGPRGLPGAEMCREPRGPGRAERRGGVPAVEQAARPPCVVLALVGAVREISLGRKPLRVAWAGRGVLRAVLTSIAQDLDPDRAPACLAVEPRTLLEAEQTHVASGFVLFSFFFFFLEEIQRGPP